ncbi:MAG: hypothetical protein ACP5HI_00660 [Caldimicrobium sp.]
MALKEIVLNWIKEDEAKEAIEIAEKVRFFVIEKLKKQGLEI